MSIKQAKQAVSDSYRDAEKYHRLLLALEGATEAIKPVDETGYLDVNDIFEKLLPDLTRALNAKQSFVAEVREGNRKKKHILKLITSFPGTAPSQEYVLGWSLELDRLIKNGKPIVIEPLGDNRQTIIKGLESFRATSAIVVMTQLIDRKYIIGVCNKHNPDLGPFLAADRMALSHIVGLVATGAQAGEQRRRELELLQETSSAISSSLNLRQVLEKIVEAVIQVTGCQKSAIFLLDQTTNKLSVEMARGLSNEYLDGSKEILISPEGRAAAIYHSEPIVIEDVDTDPRYSIAKDLGNKEGFRAYMDVPMITRNGNIGVISVYYANPHKFSQDQIDLLFTFANQAAMAVQNAQLRKREIEGLLGTSDAIKATLEGQSLLQLIVQKASEVFNAPASSLALWGEAEEILVIKASEGLSKAYVQKQRTTKETISALCTTNALLGPHFFQDLRLESIEQPGLGQQRLHKEEGLCSALCTPLQVSGDLIGVLTIYSKEVPREFSTEEVEFAALFANQAAISIESAQLHQRAKQRGDQLAALDQIALDITQRLEPRELLRAIVERATDLMQGTGGGVYTWDDKEKQFTLEAVWGLPPELEGRKITRGSGIISEILQTKQALSVSDYRSWPKRVKDFDDYDMKAVIGAPILLGEHFLGVIAVHDTREIRRFGETEEELIARFSRHAAVALENARAYDAEQTAKHARDRLLETLLTVANSDNLEAGLQALAEKMVAGLKVTFCHIMLLDENGENLYVRAAYFIPRKNKDNYKWTPVIGKTLKVSNASFAQSLIKLENPKILSRGERYQDHDMVLRVQETVGFEGKLTSILAIPLKVGGKTFGICTLGEMRDREKDHLTEKAELATTMAVQVSAFIDRMNIHEATRRRMLQLESLHLVGEEMTRSAITDPKNILDRIAQGASKVIGADCAVIYPFYKETGVYDVKNIGTYNLQKPEKEIRPKQRLTSQGLASVVLKEKRRLIVDDVSTRNDRTGEIEIKLEDNKFLQREKVKSFVSLGLWVGEEPVGALFVNFRDLHTLVDAELDAIEIFANQAAIAIENARLYENLILKLEESLTLQEVGSSLTETRDLHLVLDRVLQAAFELIHADEANIIFYDERKDAFRTDALMSKGVGQPLQPYKTRTRQRDGITYKIIKSKKPVNVSDTTIDPKINPVTLQKGRKAAFAVPLIGRESPVGVLWMHWKTPHQISERDQRLMMALAGQAAVSIENANLFEQLKVENARRDEESRALQEIGISLAETIDLDGVLYPIFQAALRLVDAEEGSILFYDEARDEFLTDALMCKGVGQPLQTYETQVRQRAGLAYEIIKGKKSIAIPDTNQDPRISKVAIEKGRRATVGVPLLDYEGPVGVLWVNWKVPRQVSSSEASLLTTLASLATVAIKSANRYAELQRGSAQLEAVHQAGKVISAASVGLDRKRVLDGILEQAIECVTGVSGSKASFGTIQLVEEETNELVVESVFPQQYPKRFIEVFERINLDPKKRSHGKIGVTGRAVLTRQAQLVPDVSKDDDYIAHNDGIKSELAIPMLDNDKVIGVLDVEGKDLNAFDEVDKDSLKLLVDLAVVALRNADQYLELQRQIEYGMATEAVAWLGLFGADWQHTINQKIFGIRNYVTGMKDLIEQNNVSSEFAQKMIVALDKIEKVADNIRDVKFTSHVPAGDIDKKEGRTKINEELPRMVNRWASRREDVKTIFHLNCPDVSARILPQWLEVAMEKLINNALKAMVEGGQLTISTSLKRDEIHIDIQDTGAGIPEESRKVFLKKAIQRGPDEEGGGMGALIAKFVVQSHGGDLLLVDTGPDIGTHLLMKLPVSPTENWGRDDLD